MTRTQERWPTRSTERTGAALTALAWLLIATAPVQAAPRGDGGSTAALRRACATGALTPYICARRGIPAPPADGAAAPSAATPDPIPATAPGTPASAPAPAPPAAEVPRPRDRRRHPQAPEGASVRPFQDTKKRYDLNIPEKWELKMQGGFATLALGNDWIQFRTASAATPQAAAATGVDLLRDQYVGFVTNADEATTVGGRAGRRLVLSAQSRAGRPSSIVVVTAPMSAGSHLVVIAGGGPEDAAVILAGVSDVVRTLRFH